MCEQGSSAMLACRPYPVVSPSHSLHVLHLYVRMYARFVVPRCALSAASRNANPGQLVLHSCCQAVLQ